MNLNDMFPSKWLKADDLPTPKLTTIQRLVQETITFDKGPEIKNILHLEGLKPLMLNKTNTKRLVKAFGDTSTWPGKRLEVYNDPEVTNMKGEEVGGVRLRIPEYKGEESFDKSWTWDEALAEAHKHAITREEIVAELKRLGHKGYVPDRDTPTVQKMIQFKVPQAFEDQGQPPPEVGSESEIPFSLAWVAPLLLSLPLLS